MRQPLKAGHITAAMIVILIVLVAGFVGYYLWGLREDSMAFVGRDQVIPLDVYFEPRSFSEVENAKALLDALAVRYCDAILSQCSLSYGQSSVNGETAGPRRNSSGTDIIKLLEKGVSEFRGTDQQLELVQILLFALKHEQLYDRWLEVYLRVLYEHPMHRLVGQLAQEAVRVSRIVEREGEIFTAFRHVSAIPMDFDSKHRIEAARLQAESKGHLSWNVRDRQ